MLCESRSSRALALLTLMIFVYQFEHAARVCGWTGSVKLDVFLSYLAGHARDVCRFAHVPPDSLADCVSLLRSSFGIRDPDRYWSAKLDALSSRSGSLGQQDVDDLNAYVAPVYARGLPVQDPH